ncbi:PH domain-containing protein [Gordonia sp. CPCC 206044]|uniref:PH domain-containing protein n=1 Tax=Gordonia sp. CPCC 206044 TaxID=3140793 RepID=UPI003AF3E2FB
MTRPEPAVRADDRPDEWHRLSPWMIAVRPIEQLPQLFPLILAIVFAGRGAPDVGVVLTIVAVPLVTVVPWLMTRYQVTDEHVRLRTGLITRKVATARRDRIRSVDLTASPPHRILRLTKIRIGTGTDKGASTVELNAIGSTDAQALYARLMDTARAPSDQTPADEPSPPEVLSRLDMSWLRFAPFSLTGFATAAAAAGLAAQAANEAGLFERGATAAERVVDTVRDIPVAVLVVGIVVAVLVVGVALSVAGYLLAYWNFSLTRRRDDHTLHVRRGLLTTNVTSLDENRIRGIHFHEPILMRPVGGARLQAIATGSDKTPLLLPPAPAAEAVRVGELVAHDGDELTGHLRRHGAGALARRVTRSIWGGAVIAAAVVVGVVVGPLPWPWVVVGALVLLGSVAPGLIRYRHLGVRVSERSVVIAPPRLARHRYAIDRDGVVGWTTRASWFQRRRGVETTVLATAAGTEAYAAVDLEPTASTMVMTTVSPDLLAPFVVRSDETGSIDQVS